MCYNGLVGSTDPSVLSQVMALRHAVPKTPPRPPVPPRSPSHKPRILPAPLESTLPQLLIPLYFNSFIANVYKKPQGVGPAGTPKFSNSSSATRLLWPTHEPPATPIPSIVYFTTPCIPRDRL